MFIDNVYWIYLHRDHKDIFFACAKMKSMRHIVILMTLMSGELISAI